MSCSERSRHTVGLLTSACRPWARRSCVVGTRDSRQEPRTRRRCCLDSRSPGNDRLQTPTFERSQWPSSGWCRFCNAQGPGGKGPLWVAYSGISFLLSDTECSQINWNLRFSTRTHSTVVLASKETEWPNCWFSNQPACHTRAQTNILALFGLDYRRHL